MNIQGRFLLSTLTFLTFLITQPFTARAQKPVITGVAGPAVNMIYAYVTQDAGLWKKHGLAKGITKWDHLKGKKVGISRFGSGTDTAIRLVCKRFGLDPAKDIVILQGGTQPSRLQALAAGSLDATLVSPPLDLTAKKQGFSVLVNVAELGIAYPQLIIETSDRFNRENPQTVKSFLKGFIEGIYYVATHKDETKKTITKYLKTSDPEILEATYQSFLQVTDYSVTPNLEGIRNAIEEVAQRVPAAKGKKPEDFVDMRFLKELEKEGFLKQFQKKI